MHLVTQKVNVPLAIAEIFKIVFILVNRVIWSIYPLVKEPVIILPGDCINLSAEIGDQGRAEP